MESYTLGLFANMYPSFDGDYRGIFIRQMVRDLELRGVKVKKAVKTSSSVMGYIPFYWQSLLLARDPSIDILQADYIPHSSLIPAIIRRRDIPLILKFHGDDGRIYVLEVNAVPGWRELARCLQCDVSEMILAWIERQIDTPTPPTTASAANEATISGESSL